MGRRNQAEAEYARQRCLRLGMSNVDAAKASRALAHLARWRDVNRFGVWQVDVDFWQALLAERATASKERIEALLADCRTIQEAERDLGFRPQAKPVRWRR